MTIPISRPPWHEPQLGSTSRLSIVSRSFSSAGRPASSPMIGPSARGDRQLRPDRRGALRDARQDLDAVEAHADGARRCSTSSPRKSGVSASGERAEASPPSSGSIGAARDSSRSTASVGNVYGSESSSAPAAPRQVGQAAEHAVAVAERLDLGVERRRLAAVERRRPDGDRGALLDLARLADHAARAAADQRRRARAPRARPRASPRARPGARRPRTRRRGRRRGRRARRARPRPPRRRRSAASGSVESPLPMRTPMPRTLPAPRRSAAGCAAVRSCGRRSSRSSARPASARPRWRSRSPSGCARDGEDPVAVSADALQLYAGLEILTGAPTAAERARLEHRLVGDPAGHRARHRRRLRAPRPRRDRRAASPRAGARSSSAAPGSTCAPRSPTSTCARRADPAARARLAAPGGGGGRAGAARRARRAATRRPPRAIAADRRPARRPRARAARRRRASRPRATSCGPRATRHPTLLVALTMEREALYARHRRARRRDGRRRRGGRGAPRGRGRRLAVGAPGARLRRAAARRRRRDEAPAPAATPSASSPGCASCPAPSVDRRHAAATPRPRVARRRSHAAPRRAALSVPAPDAVREVAGTGQRLPDRRGGATCRSPLDAAPSAALLRPPHGPGADGVLELSPPDEPGFVARLRIFNPDGSEAELSGNGAREAILYLRRAAGPTRTQFSIETAAGEIRPTILGADDVPRRHGPRAAAVRRTSPAARGRHGRGRRPPLPARRRSATRSARSASRRRRARRARPRRDRPGDRARPALPEPHERVVLVPETAPGAIRARIFERGVGETQSSGTGACGAAVALRAARRRVAGHRARSTAASSRSTSTSRCTST